MTHGLENKTHPATYVIASEAERAKIMGTEDLSLELVTLSMWASKSESGDDDSVAE